MKTINFLTGALVLFLATRAQAQTYTFNWGTSPAPAFVTGSTSCVGNNVGGSGVKVSVSITKSGGIFTTQLGPYGGPNTPIVLGSPYVVGGSSANCMIAVDFATNTDYMDMVVSFNKPVFNVSFNIGDIDRLTNTTYNYLDLITVTGYNGALSGSPTITKYDAVSDPNFLIISGNQAWVNPAMNMAGNAASDATDQKGTIKVRFGGVYITSFRIRYSNFTGTIADPTVQNIAVGNINFQTSIPLPVKLSSFDGAVMQTGHAMLNWSTSYEQNFSRFNVERSDNGRDFISVGTIYSGVESGQTHYSFQDPEVLRGRTYYRLQMVDMDGSITYSSMLVLAPESGPGMKVYPSLFHSSFHLSFVSQMAGMRLVSLLNGSGQRVYQKKIHALAGINNVGVEIPEMAKGVYFLQLEGEPDILRLVKN